MLEVQQKLNTKAFSAHQVYYRWVIRDRDVAALNYCSTAKNKFVCNSLVTANRLLDQPGMLLLCYHMRNTPAFVHNSHLIIIGKLYSFSLSVPGLNVLLKEQVL